MKTLKNLAWFSMLSILGYGCKIDPAVQPSFDVTLDVTTFKVGTPVTFNINGYADYVSFYSGTKTATYPTSLGSRYQYKDRVLADGDAYLQFNTILANNVQANSLTVLASTDFDGLYTTNDVKAATWTDVTNRFNIPSVISTTAVPSGLGMLNDFKNSAVYIAFKYVATGKAQPNWTINSLNLVYYAHGNDHDIATLDTFTVATLNPVWKGVNIAGTEAWNTSSTSSHSFTGGTNAAAANEDWLISRDLYLNRVPTDKSVPIKTYTDAMITTYQTTYSVPGVYNIDFVALNGNSKTQTSVRRSFVITITK